MTGVCDLWGPKKNKDHLTNPRDALRHKRQNLKTVTLRDHNHAHLRGDMSSFW